MTNELEQEYAKYVYSLISPKILTDLKENIYFYLITKLISEAGECFGEWCKEIYHGKNIDKSVYLDELGDVAWYIFNLINVYYADGANHYIDSIVEHAKHMVPHEKDIVTNVSVVQDLILSFFKESGNITNVVSGQLTHKEMTNKLHNLMAKYYNILHQFNFSLEEVLVRNMEKLQKRHGSQYNPTFYKGV